MSRTAMQMALEALERLYNDTEIMVTWDQHRAMKGAITALKQALAEPEQPYDQTALDLCAVCGWRTLIPGDACLNCERSKQPEQEPVAWMTPTGAVYRTEDVDGCFDYTHIPLYTAPTPRKPLTDEEIEAVWGQKPRWHTPPIGSTDIEFARAIERAHGIGEQHE